MGHFEPSLLRLLHLLVHWFRDWGWIESPQPALLPLRSQLSPREFRRKALDSRRVDGREGVRREEAPLWDRSDGWSLLRSRSRN